MPAPIDRPLDGRIALHVDATDVEHRIFTVRQRVPVGRDRAMTLLYPRWEAASHGPSLNVTDLAGLVIEGAGKRLRWRRDPYEPHAFHLQVPPGIDAIDVRFQMVAGGDLLTPNIVSVPWQRLVLYPAGYYARNITVAASLTLPPGWRPFTALAIDRSDNGRVAFAPTTLEKVLDAPVLAGRYTLQVPLTASGAGAVSLDIDAQRSSDLVVPPARSTELRNLVEQVRAVFGSAQFQRYEILALLSDDSSSAAPSIARPARTAWHRHTSATSQLSFCSAI